MADQDQLTNCYGEPITLDAPGKYNGRAYPAAPGSGPDGATCKTCRHCTYNEMYSGRRYYKCGLVRSTHGYATDIRLKTPACSRYEINKEAG